MFLKINFLTRFITASNFKIVAKYTFFYLYKVLIFLLRFFLIGILKLDNVGFFKDKNRIEKSLTQKTHLFVTF